MDEKIPIEDSLNFHLDDCIKWIGIWDRDIKRYQSEIDAKEISNWLVKEYERAIRSANRSKRIIEKEMYFVLAECTYWHEMSQEK